MEMDGPLKEVLLNETVVPAPSSGGLVPKRSTKPVEEEAAVVARRPVAELKMVAAEAGAGKKAAGSGIVSAAAEGVKAKPAGTRKTKKVMVKQEYIDCLLVQRKAHPRRPFPAYGVEGINRVYRDQPEERERLLRIWADAAAVIKTMNDKEEDILEQFRNKGYAMEEIEIRDDEDEDEN